jgi:hypothetical protein
VVEVDIKNAFLKFLLRQNSFEKDEVFDVKITSPKEAILLSIYCGAFFMPEVGKEFRLDYSSRGQNFAINQPRKSFTFTGEYESRDIITPLLGASLTQTKKDFPEIFRGLKYLKIIEYYSDYANYYRIQQAIKDAYKKAYKFAFEEMGVKPFDVLFLTIPISKNVSFIGESCNEYIAGQILKNNGFMVSEVIPFISCDDLSAFKSLVLNKLRERKIIGNGAFLAELELFKFFEVNKSNLVTTESKTLVIEAEDYRRLSDGRKQLLHYYTGSGEEKSYLKFGYYDEGYVALPLEQSKDSEIGILGIDIQGNPIIHWCPKTYSDENKKQELLKTYENYVKLILLKNLKPNKLLNIFGDDVEQIVSIPELLKKCSDLELDFVLKVVS